jgi:hypothetical protein
MLNSSGLICNDTYSQRASKRGNIDCQDVFLLVFTPEVFVSTTVLLLVLRSEFFLRVQPFQLMEVTDCPVQHRRLPVNSPRLAVYGHEPRLIFHRFADLVDPPSADATLPIM